MTDDTGAAVVAEDDGASTAEMAAAIERVTAADVYFEGDSDFVPLDKPPPVPAAPAVRAATRDGDARLRWGDATRGDEGEDTALAAAAALAAANVVDGRGEGSVVVVGDPGGTSARSPAFGETTALERRGLGEEATDTGVIGAATTGLAGAAAPPLAVPVNVPLLGLARSGLTPPPALPAATALERRGGLAAAEGTAAIFGTGLVGLGDAAAEAPGAIPTRAFSSVWLISAARAVGFKQAASLARSASPGLRPPRSVAWGSAPAVVSNHAIRSGAPACVPTHTVQTRVGGTQSNTAVVVVTHTHTSNQ